MSSISLVQSVARLLGDYPLTDTHSNAPSSSYTSLTIATGGATRYPDTGFYLDWLDDGTYDIALATAVADTSLTVAGGQFGSTQAEHAANARFRVMPRFFAHDINKTLDDSMLADLTPRMYAVYEMQLTPTTTWAAETTLIKEISATAQDVLDAYQKTDSGQTELLTVRVSQPFLVDTGLASTHKKAIRLEYIPDSNNVIYVRYTRAPAVADLSDSQVRIIEYGAAARLLEQEAAKRGIDESAKQSGTVAPGTGVGMARYYRQIQKDLIQDEIHRLERQEPKPPRRWRALPHVR